MRTTFRHALALLVGIALLSPCAHAGQRAVLGPELDISSGDGDTTGGLFGYYEIDLNGPLSAQFELNYITGDYDTRDAAGVKRSGSYDLFGIGAAIVFRWEIDTWNPYVGAGTINYFGSWDGVNYGDKLGIYWIAGARHSITDTITADLSLRYRGLRPDSVNTDIGELDLDAWVLRAGVVFEI